MIQDQAGVRDVGIKQFILPAAVVQIAVVDLTILVDMIVQRQLGFAERLAIHDNIVWFESHCLASRTIAKSAGQVNRLRTRKALPSSGLERILVRDDSRHGSALSEDVELIHAVLAEAGD